jgi:hypothetical protein
MTNRLYSSLDENRGSGHLRKCGPSFYWEVALICCRLFLSSGNERFCKSEAEYDDFVAAYME